MTKWVSSIDEVFDSAPADVADTIMSAAQAGESIRFVVGNVEFGLAKDMAFLMGDVVDAAARGVRATVVVDEALLSPDEAADLLGVSRPFVYKLLDRGEIPVARTVGTHRKVTAEEVLAWQARREVEVDAVEQLAEEAASLDDSAARSQLVAAAKHAAETGETADLERAGLIATARAGAATARAAADRSRAAAIDDGAVKLTASRGVVTAADVHAAAAVPPKNKTRSATARKGTGSKITMKDTTSGRIVTATAAAKGSTKSKPAAATKKSTKR